MALILTLIFESDLEDYVNRDRYTMLAPWIALLVFLSIAAPVIWASALDSAIRDHLRYIGQTLPFGGDNAQIGVDPYREREVMAQITAANAAYGSMAISKWALFTSLIGGLAAIVGAFYVKRTFDQTNNALQHAETSAKAAWEAVAETQKANKIAERAVVLEQRPWIVVELDNLTIRNGRGGTRFEVVARLENIGRSPALMRRTHSMAWRLPTFAPGRENFWRERTTALETIIPQGPTHALRHRAYFSVESDDPDPSRFVHLRIGTQYSMLNSDEVFETVIALVLFLSDDRLARGEEGEYSGGIEIEVKPTHGWMT